MTGVEIALIAVAAAGAVTTGISAKKQADFQSSVLLEQAQAEQVANNRESQEFEKRQRALLASARVGRAASGVAVTTGTSLLVDDASVRNMLQGIADIQTGGATRERRLRQEASLTRAGGQAELVGGVFNAGASLLGGAGKTFGNDALKVAA